jgi:hypothetical protein
MLRLLSILFFCLVIFSSCHKPTGVKNAIISADSIAINYFKGDGSMDTVTNVVIVKDKKQIEQLANYTEANSADDYKCGYDGSFHIFKNNRVIQDVDFRMNDAQCMHFSFIFNGKQYSTSLSTNAKEFLTTLKR